MDIIDIGAITKIVAVSTAGNANEDVSFGPYMLFGKRSL